MKTIFFLTLMAIARAQEGPAPLDDAEQKKLIADVDARALQYAKELPDFLCTEVMRKNVDPTGTSRHWKLLDTVHAQVTYRGSKEEYQEISLNGKKAGRENRPDGMVSVSDFADAVSWIFDPKYKTVFAWSKWDSLRGHRVHEIAFKVTADNSQLTVGKKQIKAGMLGVLDADAESGAVLRIAIVGTEIPKSSPVQAVTEEFNFDFTKIGEHYYLLPLKADVQSREGKTLSWNEFEFREYRKP